MTDLADTEVAGAGAVPCLDAIMALTNTKAARIEQRCSYVVTGYVLTHRDLAKKAIVDMAAVRWFPNVDEFMQMLTGRSVTPGPGVPPPEWGADELLAPPAPVIAASGAPAALPRPILTAPPSANLHETTESALAALAQDLGCVFNDAIPHNAGWFVPGRPTACASAYDAIRGLFASLADGGTVYRAPTVPAPDPIAAKPKAEPLHEAPQGALF